MRVNRAVVVAVVACAVIGVPSSMMAMQTPPADAGALNVYAMTLDSETLPDGYVFETETILGADVLAEASDAVDVDALAAAGFGGLYVSTYLNDDESTRIRSYVSSWASDEAASAGFELLEGDDSAFVTDGQFEDGETETGEEPRELTTGTYTEGETTVTMADTSFRQGAVIAGLALETVDESEPDVELAAELAQAMQERVAAVLDREVAETIDAALPGRVLDVEAQGFSVQIGYLTAAEVEELYGLSNTPLGESVSSFVSAVALAGVDEPPPFIAVGATILADPDAAAQVVSQAGNLVPSLSNGEQVEDVQVDGADIATAFRFSSGPGDGEEPDSYRVIFAVGPVLAVVDVQRTASIELAEETATALAAAQSACLAEGATVCELPELPQDLAPSTPAA